MAPPGFEPGSKAPKALRMSDCVAIRARGGSLGQLFANAAWGMFDLICDRSTIEPDSTWEVVATPKEGCPERMNRVTATSDQITPPYWDGAI